MILLPLHAQAQQLKWCLGEGWYSLKICCLELNQTRWYLGEDNGTPLQYSCLANPMDGGAWEAAVHGVARSRTRLHFHFSLSCIGEENGNPLQCSCLEDPRDRGAWWAAIYGIAQSQTWLKRLSSSSSSRWYLRHFSLVSDDTIFKAGRTHYGWMISSWVTAMLPSQQAEFGSVGKKLP